MTLAQLRTLVKALIFDRSQTGQTPPFTDAEYTTFINAALHDIWAVAMAAQKHLFFTTATATLTAASGKLAVLTLAAATAYPRVKYLLAGWRTDGTTPGQCEIRTLASQTLKITGVAKTVPALVLYNEGVAAIDPPASGTFELHYLHALADMDNEANTPGESGTGGTLKGVANRLPIDWHPLVAVRAAVLALKAEKADSAELERESQRLQQNLVTAAAVGDVTSEDG